MQTEPERLFENSLKSLNINYEPYYIPVESEHNYEIDFVIVDKKIGFEINGNQHYKRNGEFTEYHKRRKLYLESINWKIVDIHYLKCFNKSEIEKIISAHVTESAF